MSNGLTPAERLTPSQIEAAAKEMFEFVWIDQESVGGGFARRWTDRDLSDVARDHWRQAARRVLEVALNA